MTREAALLLGCARGAPDGSAIREAASAGIDWAAFVALAEKHGLRSLCCRRLEQACPDLVPVDVLSTLRRQLRIDSERNLFLSGELLRILDCLADGDVRALAFKGPVLAWWLYGHPGLRRFVDLDLLVDPLDLDRALELCATIGYAPEVSRSQRIKIIPSSHEISLFRTAPPAVVDLHWDLAPPEMGLALDARRMLPRSTTVEIAGRLVPTFGIEDQLLFCAFHGGKHGWANLAWLADLSALMERHPPDWPRLLAEARRQHLSRALFVGVRLVHELLGTPVPAEIRTALDRDRASAAIARNACLMLSGRGRRSIVPSEIRNELSITEGCYRKLGYCWRKITVPSVEDWELSPGTRPFRLARKYAYRLAGLE